jgi:ankyrin repeat protein
VTNGIVWAANLEVPETGVTSTASAAPVYPTIDESIARGDVADVARHLDADPAQINGRPEAKMRPLHQAILRRKVPVIELLLARGADPRLPDPAQRSPLQMAVERTDAAAVTLLLKAGADPKAKDKAGWSALHHAGAKNQLAIARLLLDGGADPNQKSELGGTPLHEAAVGGSVELIQLLLERGTDPTVVSKTGVTGLDLARQYKNEPVVRFLESRR